MYSTSAEYKTAMRAASRPYDTVYGTITFSDDTTLTVDSSVMPTNSISISKQCIDGGELMFGGVFSSELKFSVITNKDRYAFFGATIELFYKIQTGTTTEGTTVIPVYETIPLGIFTVVDAERLSNQVNLTADDNMTLLDKEIGSALITGNAWEVLTQVEEQTSYELAFDQSFLNQFVNSDITYQLSASEENGIKTYRDVVKEVCQQLGCFALDDRTGKLTLKKFSMTANLQLSYADWYSMIPADYKCKYVALSITSLAGTYTKTVDDITEVGNVMVIEDAPAWDYGSEEALQLKTDNLFTYLRTIEYTPVDLDMPSDPSFDCGDMLQLIPRNGTPATINTIITSYEWKFHQGMTITSEGVNPYLSGNTALATESSRILNQAVERSKLQFVTFTNSKAVTIGDNASSSIGFCTFTPTAQTTALFVATILVNINVADEEETETEEVTVPVKAFDGTTETTITDINGNPVTLSGTATNTYTYARDGKCGVKIHYTMSIDGGVEIKVPNNEYPYVAIDELSKGQHIITVTYPITGLTEYHRFEWKIYITSVGGTISIPAHTLQASIFGQEITKLERFDGQIVVDDEIALVNIGALATLGLIDSSSVVINNAVVYNVSDNLAIESLAHLGLSVLTDEPHIYMQNVRLITEAGDDFLLEDGSGKILVENGD